MPLLQRQEYQSDGGADIFASRSIHIRPSQWAPVDTGLSCAFPRIHWCLLKDKSNLALRHGLIVLGGVADSNYRGRIQVILHNLGSNPATIPKYTPMCQAVLIPQTGGHFQDGPVDMTTNRGSQVSFFRPIPQSTSSLGNGFQHVPQLLGTRF